MRATKRLFQARRLSSGGAAGGRYVSNTSVAKTYKRASRPETLQVAKCWQSNRTFDNEICTFGCVDGGVCHGTNDDLWIFRIPSFGGSPLRCIMPVPPLFSDPVSYPVQHCFSRATVSVQRPRIHPACAVPQHFSTPLLHASSKIAIQPQISKQLIATLRPSVPRRGSRFPLSRS